MSVTRSRKEDKRYRLYLRTADPDACAFCPITSGDPQFIEETSHFKVIYARFGYSIWDDEIVVRHVMLVPKKHLDSLANLSTSQKVEYLDIVERYEREGYNIYARAPNSAMRSIVHQHTHFIKTKRGPRRFILALRKPYIRIVR